MDLPDYLALQALLSSLRSFSGACDANTGAVERPMARSNLRR
jgi:hypothetical protein